MRKAMLLCIIMVFVFGVTGCGQKSAIQAATGASAQQTRTIEDILESAGVSYEMINEANHNKPVTAIPEEYTIYNLIDKDANTYFMVLTEDFEVVILMDSDENIFWGSLR